MPKKHHKSGHRCGLAGHGNVIGQLQVSVQPVAKDLEQTLLGQLQRCCWKLSGAQPMIPLQYLYKPWQEVSLLVSLGQSWTTNLPSFQQTCLLDQDGNEKRGSCWSKITFWRSWVLMMGCQLNASQLSGSILPCFERLNLCRVCFATANLTVEDWQWSPPTSWIYAGHVSYIFSLRW